MMKIDEIDDYSIEELSKKLPNYFDFNGDVDKTAYLNWRFDKWRNINSQFYEMGKAYFNTAIILLDGCLNNNGDNKADAWIFPIMFNTVHGIEIYLKGLMAKSRSYIV
jgi:hypothetical protein